MTRTNPYAAIVDRDSALVQDALTGRCIVCKAKPGVDCTDIITGRALLDAAGRVVHFARTAG